MSNYKKHAMREFKAAGWLNDKGEFDDGMHKIMCDVVLKLLEVFADEGHSGSSAPYAVNMFEKLAKFEPLVPLTGEDWEWDRVGKTSWQNNRCSHVFKDTDRFNGQAYDREGIIFYDIRKDDEGKERKSHFTSRDSAVPVTFPYTPKREYRERKAA